jgi:hypothetical protein
MRKLTFNTKVRPNSGESYINEPAVVETDRGRHLVFGIKPERSYTLGGNVERTVAVFLEERVISYKIDDDTKVEFDEESGTGTFISRGNQYKIRALQDSDESWIINFKLPQEDTKS